MQFSFAFSGKLHRVSDFIAKFDQGTWNASAFHPPKTSDHCLTEALPELFELFTSRWQLIHYIRSSFVCQELFSIFFQDFQSVPGVFATFSDRRSSEAAYLVYQTGTRLSRTFFISFSTKLSGRPPSQTAWLLYALPPRLSTLFSSFFDLSLPIHILRLNRADSHDIMS